VGLGHAANQLVRSYSLGMRGRLSLANALLGEPALLVLDEPTNGLDPAGIREMRDLIRALPGLGVTVLLSSHLLAEIEQVASHIGILAGGKMRFSGSIKALKAEARATIPPTISVRFPSGAVHAHIQALTVAQVEHAGAFLKDNTLFVPLAGDDMTGETVASNLGALLWRNGIAFHHLSINSNSLEDLFFALTEGATTGDAA
jgi:lantibiotic transport system ATP-binding protein